MTIVSDLLKLQIIEIASIISENLKNYQILNLRKET
jgi:hypothetical protein